MRWLGAMVVVVATVTPVVAAAQEVDPTAPAAQQLAERHVPVMLLKEQRDECDPEGEPFDPIAVEAVLGNREVALRQLSDDGALIQWAPTAGDLFGLGGGTYLDFPGRALDPGCLYERDGRRFSDGSEPTIYAHIVQQPDHPELLALQYWFYWYYNDWNNKHESDWEGIQLLFEASTVEEALASEPISVGYAQHEGGERRDWDDEHLGRDGDRPIVYTSARSHASYFGDATYLGRGASEGFGCDDTTGPSRRVDPEVVLLPDSVDDPASPLAWLAFGGRWGERQSGPFNAPTGLVTKFRWTNPVDWHTELRDSSVTVPEPGSAAAEVVDAFCGVVEWGSRQVVVLKESPTRLVLTAGALVLAVWLVLRRTSWNPADPHPTVLRRRSGQIVRLAFTHYRAAPLTLAATGLLAVPIVLAVSAAVGVAKALPLVGPLLDLGDSGESSRLGLSLLGGGVATAVSMSLVTAAVAWLADRHDDGQRPGARAAWRAVLDRGAQIAGAVALQVGVPTLLVATVLGSPIALWLAVRWVFAPQAVMLEDAAPAAAVRRSTVLTRGRWLHTALVSGAVSTVVLSAGFVVALMSLVAFSGLAMWTLSVIAGLVSALAMPLGALILTLLYGDARSAHDEHGATTDVRLDAHASHP